MRSADEAVGAAADAAEEFAGALVGDVEALGPLEVDDVGDGFADRGAFVAAEIAVDGRADVGPLAARKGAFAVGGRLEVAFAAQTRQLGRDGRVGEIVAARTRGESLRDDGGRGCVAAFALVPQDCRTQTFCEVFVA